MITISTGTLNVPERYVLLIYKDETTCVYIGAPNETDYLTPGFTTHNKDSSSKFPVYIPKRKERKRRKYSDRNRVYF